MAIFFGLVFHVGRDIDIFKCRAQVFTLPDNVLHADQIDQAVIFGFRTNRQIDDAWRCAQTVDDHIYTAIEVSTHAVHLVDEAHTRHFIFISLTPDRFGLRLNTRNRIKHSNRTIEHTQATLHLNGEIDVTGGIDNVDAMIPPETGRRSGRDRDAALLLLLHPVHGGIAIMHFADLMGPTGIVQDSFSCGRLTRINMGHNANIAVMVDRGLA